MKPIPMSAVAKTLSHFKNPAAVMPVLIVEAFTTAGRTYQGYKRGGETEARERLMEESSSAAVWLFGAKFLNKLGDTIGKKVFKLEHLNVDVGKDPLRQPFENMFKDLPKNLKNKTAIFKFSKIFASIAIATTTVGFVIPKIKQNITKRAQEKKTQTGPKEGVSNTSSTLAPAITTVQSYIDSLKAKNPESKVPFKGVIDKLLVASHKIEHNNAWRLVSTDTGMIAGRTLNSRNEIEAREFLFRDTASIYFYMLAAPHTVKFLNKLTKTVDIHPQALLRLQKTLDYNMKTTGQTSMTPHEFEVSALGGRISDVIKNVAFDKNNVVSLASFNETTVFEYADTAKKMSRLQPKLGGVSILSKQQAEDVLKDSWTSKPGFLKNAISRATYGASVDKTKFVERSKVEGIRNSIDDFTKYIADYAAGRGVEVDSKLIDKLVKDNIRKGAAFTFMGLAVAVIGLGVIIPKVKDFITKKTTGRDEFPGAANYDTDK